MDFNTDVKEIKQEKLCANKEAIIWCDTKNNTMFPFEFSEGNCMIPAGNKTLIERNISLLKKMGIKAISIIAKITPRLREVAEKESCNLINLENYGFKQIVDIWKYDTVLIMSGNCYVDESDLKKLVHATEETVLVKKWKDREIGFGCRSEYSIIKDIYGFPRDHYVNEKIFPIFVVRKQYQHILKYVTAGALNINCGQMPDEKYHLENILIYLVNNGVCIHTIECSNKIVNVNFPWEILEINEQICNELDAMKLQQIDETSKVLNIKQTSGVIRVGKRCNINNVIFEGNCWIGDDVELKDGVIVGKNCIILDGTKAEHTCFIHRNSVIGKNNKIGFGAEISGLTMEGVCAVHGCEIFGVIGKYVDIAAGVIMAILKFNDTFVKRYVNGKIYETPYTNCVCIGDYTRTGINSIFFPGVSVGKKCAIGPGVIVEQDILNNHILMVKQELSVKSWDSNKYGW